MAGATTMRYKPVMVWTFGACLVWASTYVGIGYIAKASYQEVASNFKFGALAFVGILAIFILIIHFAKTKISKVADQMIDEEIQKTNK